MQITEQTYTYQAFIAYTQAHPDVPLELINGRLDEIFEI